ncbi:uncharacterized protein ColSpa_09974 [Colletotrichum spaethianum]|uniref:Uncharacterized protein n=1 Tax=Colletotrichum spaethianum TaxID=700344 RepID=A0AA37PCK3_9PEZI|nr:uncharacterized protein ColSpa_09974 [Colletotrichum spaethianum]GKT49793.1 hypothetical protein ColSpa_09974 [Colletotrichum spaethianum]
MREFLGTLPINPWIDPRFYYGELRLSRLNKIYFFWKTPLRGYKSRWNQYGSFFQDNFTWLASLTVYIAVVLTAMAPKPSSRPRTASRSSLSWDLWPLQVW